MLSGVAFNYCGKVLGTYVNGLKPFISALGFFLPVVTQVDIINVNKKTVLYIFLVLNSSSIL